MDWIKFIRISIAYLSAIASMNKIKDSAAIQKSTNLPNNVIEQLRTVLTSLQSEL
jgi:hypothetical protein